MATKLSTPVMRDTGLEHNGKAVVVALSPSSNGGDLVFRPKGSRNPISVCLSDVMESAINPNRGSEAPQGTQKAVKGVDPDWDRQSLVSSDTVDLAQLESQLMIAVDPDLDLKAKSALYRVIRGLRETRRKELNLPSVPLAAKELIGGR